MRFDLSPKRLLTAYALGIFPMADERGRIEWFSPDPRAVLELDHLKVSRSLRTAVRQGRFDIRLNQAFPEVIEGCANRGGTWISREIKQAYLKLHHLGFAHSVEAWKDGALVGGLYGVCLRGAFFGESMFHRATDASKVALVHLVERMQARGMVLLDIQFLTPHLERLGAVEIPREEYELRLYGALRLPVSFLDGPEEFTIEFVDKGATKP